MLQEMGKGAAGVQHRAKLAPAAAKKRTANVGPRKTRTIRLPGTMNITARVPAKVSAPLTIATVPAAPPAPKSNKWVWILVVAAGMGAVWYLVRAMGAGRGRRNPFGR